MGVNAVFAFTKHIPGACAINGFSVYGKPTTDFLEELGGFVVEGAVGFDGDVEQHVSVFRDDVDDFIDDEPGLHVGTVGVVSP